MKKTKNIVVIISGFCCIMLTTSLLLVLNDSCGIRIKLCKDIYNLQASFLFIFPFVFLFSLLTYFLRNEIFNLWKRFTYIWIPISIIFVFIMPGDSGGGFFPSLIDKQTVAILMSGLYFIISLIVIVWGIVKYNFLIKK